MDKHSLIQIKTLHPYIQNEVFKAVEFINKNILTSKTKVRIEEGFRSFERQSFIFAKGRAAAGKIVTNADAGFSFHNYGLAFDICLITDEVKLNWENTKDFDGDKTADWEEVVKYFKSLEYTWGGDFKSFKDLPHFEKAGLNKIQDLQLKHKNKDFIQGTNFIKI